MPRRRSYCWTLSELRHAITELQKLVFSTNFFPMDKAISASEANQRFSELLREVADGESFTVTSRGRPVARMLPVDRTNEHRSVKRLIKFLRRLPLRHSGDWTRADLYE